MTVSADYRKLAKRYRTLPEQVVRAGAKPIQKAVLDRLGAATGGDRRLSGFTRRAGRHQPMGVSVSVSAGISLFEAEVRPGPKRFGGMWSILEYGARPHLVGRPRGGMTRGLHMKYRGDDWFTGPTRNPTSSPAKHVFADGVRDGTPAAERAMADAWERGNG